MQYSKFWVFILLSLYLRWSSALNCSNDAFNCGNIMYIAYPFWGGPRPSECGLKPYKIICKTNTPIIKISSLSYMVNKLDFSTNTMTVARLDLQRTYCPRTLRNTTLNWDLFEYPPKSTDRNLTLSFDCTPQTPPLPNAFTCANHAFNLFNVDASPQTNCTTHIYVPINKDDAQSLQNPTASSINIITSALTTGFSIRWFYDALQGDPIFCNDNIYNSCRRCPLLSMEGCGDDVPPGVRSEGPGAAPVPSPAQEWAPGPSPRPVLSPVPTPAGNGLRNPLQNYNITRQTNHGKNHTRKIFLVVPLTVGGMVIASISIHCLLRRRRLLNGHNTVSKHDMETFILQQGSLAPKRYRYSEIKKITKSLSHKLGQGGYGSVYKGMLPGGCPVAVKVLIQTDSNGEEFINEVASISRTSHVNIVTLLGFCYEGNRRALVYEFMPNSSLDKFLNHNQSHCPLDLEKLYKIAVGIAKGLEYLHKGCNTRIVHFDIKPQNILLDDDLCPKISDFGLAKLYKKKQSVLSVLGARGTAGYIAPEVFSRNFGGVSHKSDVYSYGMMLLEMAQGRKVDEDEVIQSSENYFPDKIYEEVISNAANIVDLEMGGEEETSKKMPLVGFWCIQTIPSSRPSISKVVEMLEGSLESIRITPKPFLFPPNLPSHNEIPSAISACGVTQNSVQS